MTIEQSEEQRQAVLWRRATGYYGKNSLASS